MRRICKTSSNGAQHGISDMDSFASAVVKEPVLRTLSRELFVA